jgi:hypothetical protein
MDDVATSLESVTKALEKIGQTPVGQRNPLMGRQIMAGYGAATPSPGNPGGWPVEQLDKLKPYDMEAARCYMKQGPGGNQRGLLGWGPMLIKMGAMGGMPGYREAAQQLGNWSPNYGEEQLEKEFRRGGHGPCSVMKARAQGVPWEPKGSAIHKAALAEASGVTGGYLIPPDFRTELLAIQAEEAFVKPRAKVQPMNSRTVQWPTLDITTVQAAGASPYFAGIVAGWQPEAALINETEPAFRLSDWTAWDLVMYAVSSNQLLADNGIGLDALMTMLFGQAVVWYEEYAYLRGTGAGNSMPLGVLNSPCSILQTRTAANLFTLADAAAMFSHLQIRSWQNACWIMHQSVIPQLIQMASGAVANTASTTYIPGNMLVWTNPWNSTGTNGPMASALPMVFLNGLPIFFTEKLPKLGTVGDVMLVDFAHYIIGQRLDTQIDISPHYLFRNNQLAWRVVFRSDGKFWLNNSITDAEGWSISPSIILK